LPKRPFSDRIDAVKAAFISIISLVLVVIAGTGKIAVEVIAMWQFVRGYVNH